MSERFDVVVAGGGPAGIAAAVSAARGGARTLLVEPEDTLGGNATQAFVHTFCGVFLPAEDGRLPEYANPGLPRLVAEELGRAGGAGGPQRIGKVWVLPTSPPVLGRYAAALCDRTAGLEWWIGATVTAASLASTDGPSRLGIAHRGRAVAVESRIVIDATGDATVGFLAGADVVAAPPALLQCPSYIFCLGRVTLPIDAGYVRMQLSVAAAGAVRRGELPDGCESILVRPALDPNAVYVTLNLAKGPERPYDPLDEDYRSELAIVARRRCEAIVAYLKRTRAEFKDAEIVAWPRRVGIRETRRIRGRVTIGADEVLNGTRSDDEVALSSWPVELWDSHERPTLQYPRAACSIPLGALVSRTHASLGVAGRCLSATHEALGALRVIGTALATGEAIGVAAALAAERTSSLPEVAPADVRAVIHDRSDRA